MQEEMAETSERSILLPVLLSGLAGAGLALILAPKAGREIRSDIRRIASSAGDQISEAIGKGKELYEQGIPATESIAEAAKQTYAAGKESLEEVTAGPEEQRTSLVVPILVSAVVGAGIALLFAPKSGGELWEDIKDASRSAMDAVGSAIEKGKAVYQETTAGAREAAEKAIAEGKEKVAA